MRTKVFLIKVFGFIRKKGFASLYYRVREKLLKRYTNYQFIPVDKEELNKQNMNLFESKPKISIIVPVFNTDHEHLRQMIESVLCQTYSNLELCIFNGGSTDEEIGVIIKEYCNKDGRIKYSSSTYNHGISNNTNLALELASGEYIGLLDHDDLLSPNALFEVVNQINKSSPDIIYSDEDKITSDGKRHMQPHFKSDWAPDTLLSNNYICHFLVFRKRLLDEVGMLRKDFDGSQDYDLILRLSSKSKVICHIPKVLYHWRMSSTSTSSNFLVKNYALDAGRRALECHFSRMKQNVIVEEGEMFGFYKYRSRLPILIKKVTIIVIGKWGNKEERRNYYNDLIKSTDLQVVTFYFLDISGTYNHSYNINFNCKVYELNSRTILSLLNKIILVQSSEHVIVMNSNIIIKERKWIESLVLGSQRDDLFVIAPKILYKNRIFSYGLAVTKNSVVNIWQGLNKNYYGYLGRLKSSHNVTSVHSSLFLLKKKSFIDIGQFDERFNDSLQLALIDYSLRGIEKGYFVKVIPEELVEVSRLAELKCDLEEKRLFFEKNIRILNVRDRYLSNEVQTGTYLISKGVKI